MLKLDEYDYACFNGDALSLVAANLNMTRNYLTASTNGNIVATSVYGDAGVAVCEYAILGRSRVSIQIGRYRKVNGGIYVLESVHYETGADSEPVFSCSVRRIEDDAFSAKRYSFSSFLVDVSPDEVAKDPLPSPSCTIGGDGCELIKCSVDVACSVKMITANGKLVASDISDGLARITLTIGQYGDAKPTVTAKTGWDISAPLSYTSPDADLPIWTVTLSKPLERVDIGA